MILCRGIRGATTCDDNTRSAVLAATRELLDQMVAHNGIELADVASVIFTTTPDLTAEFPAVAAREMGWQQVPMLCTHEMAVPHGLPRCIRVLMHWNTDRSPERIRHIYLRGAVALRPDWAQEVTPSTARTNDGPLGGDHPPGTARAD